MQYKTQDKQKVPAKPPAAGGSGIQMRINGQRSIKGRDTSSRRAITALFSATTSTGLATVLYGIQDACGLLAGDKLRKQQMMKELLIRRALSPPTRRLSLRWRNFQPTPSRLSMMSSA